MSYVPPLTRKDGKSFGRATHWYLDGNGDKVPGVTSILSDGWPKPALINWAGNATAEYAINNWDALGDKPIADRLKELKGSRYAERDAAANRGTAVHALGEQLVQGLEVDVPDELAGHVESYVSFLDTWAPQPLHVEATVVNYTVGYAGTLDLIADLADGRRYLLDIKTNRSGVYGDVGLQLAAYRYAEYLVSDGFRGHLGGEIPMPEVDACAIIHVRADGYDLVPVRADDYVFKRFRHVAVVARAGTESKEWIGAPLQLDHQETA